MAILTIEEKIKFGDAFEIKERKYEIPDEFYNYSIGENMFWNAYASQYETTDGKYTFSGAKYIDLQKEIAKVKSKNNEELIV